MLEAEMKKMQQSLESLKEQLATAEQSNSSQKAESHAKEASASQEGLSQSVEEVGPRLAQSQCQRGVSSVVADPSPFVSVHSFFFHQRVVVGWHWQKPKGLAVA